MKNLSLIITLTFVLATISGCITEQIEKQKIDDGGLIGDTNDGKLTIVTYDVYGLTQEMLDNFENETGYEITMLKLDDSGSVLDHLLQHKNNQVADLAIGLDNTYLPVAEDHNVLWKHGLELPNLSSQISESHLTDFAAPFDHGYICLNYDKSVIDGENYTIPTSLWDLTSEEFNGKVAIPSPETSSPGRAFMSATTYYFDMDEDNTTDWTDWWKEMSANDVIITSGWSEAYEIHYSGGYGQWEDGHIGDAHFVVSYCHSPGVEAHFGGNYTISATLNLDNLAFHQIEYASIVEGANLAAANAFIEYLLSEEINSEMPVQNYMYSILENSSLPEDTGYKYNSVIPDKPAIIDQQSIIDNMDEWLSMWNSAMVDA